MAATSAEWGSGSWWGCGGDASGGDASGGDVVGIRLVDQARGHHLSDASLAQEGLVLGQLERGAQLTVFLRIWGLCQLCWVDQWKVRAGVSTRVNIR